ncbi:hypothetical protein [Neosynechococcus sphagnicola]|uniref:hypothetical protein n=1 Tax=Neosynechococcus sphagnicola TaxID=1501145 RepID=UPI00195534A6|nr:hypothetical protein [Neosynechococcus sphagnicola]
MPKLKKADQAQDTPGEEGTDGIAGHHQTTDKDHGKDNQTCDQSIFIHPVPLGR